MNLDLTFAAAAAKHLKQRQLHIRVHLGVKIKQPYKCYDKKTFSKDEADSLCLQEPFVNGNCN